MRYVVPVNAPAEVGPLVAAGADELYCGYQDAWWVERYGDHDSASRRQGAANLSSMGELGHAARLAGEHGVPLYLALNARYTEPQLGRLVSLCSAFEGMGGTGVIVSDLGLLWRLRDATGLVRCLSLLAVTQNAPTLRAYRELGVSRVVLPRFMGHDEAGALLGAVSGMEAEVMAFFDKCPWVDGYCRHRHGVSYLPRGEGEGPGAVRQREAAGGGGTSGRVPEERVPEAGGAPRRLGSGDAPSWPEPDDAPLWPEPDDAPPIFTFDTTYQTHACLRTGRAHLWPHPCAACHLRHYESAGVGFAKLGGRGQPLDERLRALRFLREAEAQGTDEERVALYRSTFGEKCACYFGSAIQDRSAIEGLVGPASRQDRTYLGSESALGPFREALASLCQGRLSGSHAGITLLVPPLADGDLAELEALLPVLAERCQQGTRLCVNDLGTLVALARVRREQGLGVALSMGTLLARLDDPDEVVRFTTASLNPPRMVWGPDGEARVLRYRRPPETLVRHWRCPSSTEPSAQAALRFLTGGLHVPYEHAPACHRELEGS